MDAEDKVPVNKYHGNGEENNIRNGTVTVVVQSPGWDIRPGGGGESGGKTIRNSYPSPFSLEKGDFTDKELKKRLKKH